MYKISKILLLFGAVTTFVIASCKKEPVFQPVDISVGKTGSEWIPSDRDETDGASVLGSQRENAFHVDVVRQAYNNLYSPDVPYIAPTHLYVRFLPQSLDDVGKLAATGIDLWDTPLDYEVAYDGEFYHDPSVNNPDFTWMYAVVEPTFSFPTVTYEVLAPIVDIPENTLLAKEAFTITHNLDIYEDTGHYLSAPGWNNGTLTWPPEGDSGADPGIGGACNCPQPGHSRYAAGCVQVKDNNLDIWEPVKRIKVGAKRVGLAFFTHWDETDENGCFEIKHKYYNKAKIFVKYSSSFCDIKIMKGPVDAWGYTFVRKYEVGTKNGPNFNGIEVKIDWTSAINTKAFRRWIGATVNNSVHEFGAFASKDKFNSPPGNLKILITPWDTDGNTGATPMFDKVGTGGFLFGDSDFLAAMAFKYTGPLLPLTLWIALAAPDIVLNWNNAGQSNADDVREVAYHELSHAAHYTAVNDFYWKNNILYVVANEAADNNPPYGNINTPGADHCAIIESWGFMMGMKMADQRYLNAHSNGTPGPLGRWGARLEMGMNIDGYINHGWLNDLLDHNPANPFVENPTIGTGGDNARGFTLQQIFSSLATNTGGTSPGAQRDYLRDTHLPSTPTTLTQYTTLTTFYPFFY